MCSINIYIIVIYDMDWEKAWKRKILKIKEKIVKRKNM